MEAVEALGWRVGVGVVAMALAASAGCGGARGGAATVRPGWSAVPGQVAVAGTATARSVQGEPVLVSIPAIGVRSSLERLGVDGRGELVAPSDPNRAGWFAAGVRPGDPGPAVIAGHVDSRTGPAVFTRLGELRPGARVTVTDARGGSASFVVDGVRTYPKSGFPTGDVYGPTPDAELRLITCGGDFDHAAGHYTANVVVFAHRTG